MKTIERKWGWRPDLPDHRDFTYSAPSRRLKALPPKVDLRALLPKTHFDQGQLGSCVGNASSMAHLYAQVKQGKDAGPPYPTTFVPSRLMVYYNARALEGTINQDAGCYIRDAMKSMADKGVCPETMWKYDVGKFRTKPPAAAYKEALKHQAVTYCRVPVVLQQIKACLAEGYPITFGFTVYENFSDGSIYSNGIMQMPYGSVLGGHAVLAVGYDDEVKRLTVRNSWGNTWGNGGDFYMPYDYITPDLTDDWWKLTLVEQ